MGTHIPRIKNITTGGSPLRGVLSSRLEDEGLFVVQQDMTIDEASPWQLKWQMFDGTPPYTNFKAFKSADDLDSEGNIIWIEIPDQWYTTDGDSIVFTSSGSTGNDRFYRMRASDGEGTVLDSPVFDLDVTPNDPEDPDPEEPTGSPPVLSALVTWERIAGATSGNVVAGDTLRFTFRATNGTNANPLTNVSLIVAAPTGTVTGPASVGLPDIDDTQVWTVDHTITAAEENTGKYRAEGTFTCTEVADKFVFRDVNLGSQSTTAIFGWWGESNNNWPHDENDPGVETIFDNYSFALTKGYALGTAFAPDSSSREYVVNIIEKAKEYGCAIILQLGNSGDYGWNFSTGRGNFNVDRWKDGVSKFAKTAQPSFFGSGNMDFDPVAHARIIQGLEEGTIRYMYTIDEPQHKRWSPQWDGSHASQAPGSSNYCTNEHLDEMSEYIKYIFGEASVPINITVRASAYNLGLYGRTYPYTFQHLTHEMLSISSNKWETSAGSRSTGNKSFQSWLTQRDNLRSGYTYFNAAYQQNLKRIGFIQFGFASKNHPRINGTSWRDEWWENQIRYPYLDNGFSYVKISPMEADYICKQMLAFRDPVTGAFTDEASGGERTCTDIMCFRHDRNDEENQWPITSYPHYRKMLDQWRLDFNANPINIDPHIGIGLDWDGENPSEESLNAMWNSRDPIF